MRPGNTQVRSAPRRAAPGHKLTPLLSSSSPVPSTSPPLTSSLLRSCPAAYSPIYTLSSDQFHLQNGGVLGSLLSPAMGEPTASTLDLAMALPLAALHALQQASASVILTGLLGIVVIGVFAVR